MHRKGQVPAGSPLEADVGLRLQVHGPGVPLTDPPRGAQRAAQLPPLLWAPRPLLPGLRCDHTGLGKAGEPGREACALQGRVTHTSWGPGPWRLHHSPGGGLDPKGEGARAQPPPKADQRSPATSGLWMPPSTSVSAWPPLAVPPEQEPGPQGENSNGGFRAPEREG